ncbi:MAG: hypothetical protein Q7T20_01050 [Saprospiraceae bacterium]|nr:hypothetical protein [Saprospiraceae bacterium]
MTILDQPQQQTQSIVYASFVERVAARLIDALILIIPSVFIPFVAPWLYYAVLEGSERTISSRYLRSKVTFGAKKCSHHDAKIPLQVSVSAFSNPLSGI